MSENQLANKLDTIIHKLQKMEQDIECVKIEINNLKIEIDYIKKGNDIVTNHVSFIENVYDTIKTPFYFILNKIQPISHIPEKKCITSKPHDNYISS
jgi:hypothetical protein